MAEEEVHGGVESSVQPDEEDQCDVAYESHCKEDGDDCEEEGVHVSILEKTNDAGIPVYGSEIEQMKLGCVGGAGLDYVALGVQTGKMAARILKGEAACQDIPYEVIENYALYINSEVVTQLNLTLPDEVKAEAQDVVNA